MDENFAYWPASFERARKWFSSSLALGTSIVAIITGRLPSDMPCYHDHTRCRCPSYFNPHGGPITHSSTGSKPESPVHLVVRVIPHVGSVCNSRATFREITNSGIRQNTYSSRSEPPFTLCFRQRTIAYALETSIFVPSYFALNNFLSCNSRVTFRHLPRCYRPDS